MNLETLIAAASIIGLVTTAFALLVIRHKYKKLYNEAKGHEGELAQKAYESEVLRAIGQELGYFLDAAKIIEIISASLDRLLPYSVVSYLVDPNSPSHKIKFWCKVKEPVSQKYIEDIKHKMLMAFSEMSQNVVVESDVEQDVSGGLIDNKIQSGVGSFFNLPIIVSGKAIALINISSTKQNLYTEKNTDVLYRMAKQVSETVTKLQDVIESEKARLNQAVESLSDGVLMVDNKMQLVLINSKLIKMLGLPQNPTTLDVFSKLESHLDLRTMVETATHSAVIILKKEIEVNGRVLEVMTSRVTNQKTGVAMGVVVTFYDATDAKNLERLRSEFMALMVHELRAPLTTIKSTVEYINEEGLKNFKQGEIDHHLQVIHSTSQSMLELVSDLLDVAKIEAGKFDVICEPADLGSAINVEVESFRPLAEEKKIKLVAKVQEDLPEASFDKIRLRQVLNNLISNAIKFTDAGTVTVKVEKEIVAGSAVDIKVSVADTGIGIDEGEADKLFAKFGQLKNGRDQAGVKSSGLGLFISRGIVEAMGGKIWVESAGPGLGSTFIFTVPVARENQKKISADEDEIVFSTKRIARA